jgi:RibD C-terminal domain
MLHLSGKSLPGTTEIVDENHGFEIFTCRDRLERSETTCTLTYGGAVSLDGFLAGADGSLDWLHFSKDVQQVTADYWKDVDTILMGRKTYAVSVANNPKKIQGR